VGIDPGDIEPPFDGFEVSDLEIPNFNERSIEYNDLKFKHLTVKIMNPLDIALSKIHRGEQRDIDDVKTLLNHKKINITELDTQFRELARSQNMQVRTEFMDRYTAFKMEYKHKK
jgi:Na+-transporting NADH:ubiquinone oxidoreductase subunit NqrA